MSGGGGGLYGGGASWGGGGGGGSSYIGNDRLEDLSSSDLKRMVGFYNLRQDKATGKWYIDNGEQKEYGFVNYNPEALIQPNDPREFLTISTKDVSDEPTKNHAKKGNGYAIITSI